MKLVAIILLVLGVVLVSAQSEEISSDYSLMVIAQLLSSYVMNTLNFLVFGKEKFVLSEVVTFWCRTPSREAYMQMTSGDPGIATKLDLTKGLVLIVHGFTDSKDRTWMDRMARDYNIYTDNNACLVDWHKLANMDYMLAASHVDEVGEYLGQFLLWSENYISLNRTMITGFSLGSHVAGIAGAYVGGRLGAIFGTDPAHPLITLPMKDISERLDPTDAQFVQTVHTSKGVYGTPYNIGHQDWYSDGGYAYQKGCVPMSLSDSQLAPIGVACSHIRANEIHRYALNPDNKFWNEDKSDFYGYHSRRIPGVHYFVTKEEPPFVV